MPFRVNVVHLLQGRVTIIPPCKVLYAPTVEREHNQYGEEFVACDPKREQFERDRMVQNPVYLTDEQRLFVEEVVPSICERGQWIYHIVACQADHLHLLISDCADAVGGSRAVFFIYLPTGEPGSVGR